LIKSEGIKAKNQLDIENLMHQDRVTTAQSVNYEQAINNQNEAFNEQKNRLDERM